MNLGADLSEHSRIKHHVIPPQIDHFRYYRTCLYFFIHNDLNEIDNFLIPDVPSLNNEKSMNF